MAAADVPIDDLWLIEREREREKEARRGGQEDVRGAGLLSFPLLALERFALLQWSWRTACLKETSLAHRGALLQQRISNYELPRHLVGRSLAENCESATTSAILKSVGELESV